MQLNILEELPSSFRASTLIAGWPGMGSVGIGAIDYIRRKLDAVAFAEIDMNAYFTPEMMMVDDGVVSFPSPPAHTFYAVEAHNLIIFQGDAQINGEPGDEAMNQVLDVAQKAGVDTVFTAASYHTQASHQEGTQVLAAANNPDFRDSLEPFGVEILQEGMVTGLNGLLLGFAAQRGFRAACLLGTIPQYAVTIPNPKASKQIVLTLGRILNFEVDMGEIDDAAERMEATMEEIEGQIQKNLSPLEDAPDKDAMGGKKEEMVPQHVMERIEQLFLEVTETDMQVNFQEKANELKEELDRWDLYSFYEDRFLNLFRSDSGG